MFSSKDADEFTPTSEGTHESSCGRGQTMTLRSAGQ